MQLRQKALKLGLNPEALTGKYPVSCELFIRIFNLISSNVTVKFSLNSPKSDSPQNLRGEWIPVLMKRENPYSTE